MQKLFQLASRLQRDEQGSVIVWVVSALLMFVAAIGLAVDFGRAQLAQSRLHASLDAAGLAAASVAQSRDAELEAKKFFFANFPEDHMGTDIDEASFVATATEQEDDVTGERRIIVDLYAPGSVETVFMKFFGIDAVDIAAAAQVIQSRSRGFELVMVLDNSGSMGGVEDGVTRSEAMINAANQLLEQVYGERNSADDIFIGLVPFNHRVRVGGAKNSSSQWLYEKDGDRQLPISGDVECIYTNSDAGPYSRDITWYRTDVPPDPGFNPTALFRDFKSTDTNCVSDNDNREMTPLLQNRNEVEDALAEMRTSGATRIDLGAVWGWRMLSPRWSGKWAHDNPASPLPYNTSNMDKVIIILTDGVNCCDSVVPYANESLSDVCTGMNNAGINVYTITFHIDDISVRNLMRDCASTADNYYHAEGSDDLEQVFLRIADSLNNLRISE